MFFKHHSCTKQPSQTKPEIISAWWRSTRRAKFCSFRMRVVPSSRKLLPIPYDNNTSFAHQKNDTQVFFFNCHRKTCLNVCDRIVIVSDCVYAYMYIVWFCAWTRVCAHTLVLLLWSGVCQLEYDVWFNGLRNVCSGKIEQRVPTLIFVFKAKDCERIERVAVVCREKMGGEYLYRIVAVTTQVTQKQCKRKIQLQPPYRLCKRYGK